MKSILAFFGLIIMLDSSAQVNYQVKFMTWNLLNFPVTSNLAADTTNRCPSYREIVNYVKPDIMVTQENTTSSSSTWFLNQVMNTGSYHYAAGTFINGYDTDNCLFYRDSLFEFVSNTPIQTSVRDINQFTVIFKPTGDTLHIFSVHLKAGLGDESQRAAEVAALRQVTNAFPAGTNFMVAGDFNIYEAGEPAYVNMLHDNPNDDGNFLDHLNLTGVWNNPAYAPYHTQSTHYSSSGGFSGGGMNDRFDMILYSNGVEKPTGVYYLPGTYLNLGNDGNHYDVQINWNTNTAAPLSVINALYNTSDHLPIIMELAIGPTSGIDDINSKLSDIEIYPMPVNENSSLSLTAKSLTNIRYSLMDAFGKTLFESESILLEPGRHNLPVDWNYLKSSGFYFMTIRLDNYLISKKIIKIN